MVKENAYEKIIRFFEEVNSLKRIKRSGWIVDKVKNPESVAEHSFRTALMCIFLGRGRNLNMERLLKMVLIHDIGEAKIGDIITYWRYDKAKSRNEKIKKERKALNEMLLGLENRDEIFSLWEEFENQKTEEAKFVKQIERLEMSLQALEYEKEGNKNIKKHYYQQTEETLTDPELIKFFKELMLRRTG